MVSLEIKVEDEEVRQALLRAMKKLGDLSPLMKDFGERMKRSVVQNFIQGGRPEKWKPLKTSTLVSWAMRKRSLWGGGTLTRYGARAISGRKPLIDTGRLMKSITYRAGKDEVRIGTNVIYAAIHQFGGKAGRGRKVKIPARPFLLIQDEDKDYILRVTKRFIEEAIR